MSEHGVIQLYTEMSEHGVIQLYTEMSEHGVIQVYWWTGILIFSVHLDNTTYSLISVYAWITPFINWLGFMSGAINE